VPVLEASLSDDYANLDWSIRPDFSINSGTAKLSAPNEYGGSETVWIWRPFLVSVPPKIRNDLRKSLYQLLQQKKLVSKPEDLDDKSVIENLILNHPQYVRDAHLDALKKNNLPSDLNLTSLCLYSGPYKLIKKFGRHCWRSRAAFPSRESIGPWNPRPGWLGTGDARIVSDDDFDRFDFNLGAYVENIGILNLPHHGSDYSSDQELLKRFEFDQNRLTCQASAARGNVHKHPSRSKHFDTAGLGMHFVLVTQDLPSRWTQAVTCDL